MKVIFLKFSEELKDLKDYISTQNESAILLSRISKDPDSSMSRELRDYDFRKKKIFDYNAYIISLYGIFERYIESIFVTYLDELTKKHFKYNDLPKKILESNVKKTSELLINLTLPKYKNEQENQIIECLSKNLNSNNPKINNIAFSHHSTNFRHQFINDYFKGIGVDSLSQNLISYLPLKDFFIDEYSNTSSIKHDILYSTINELADRRNDVAHGVDNIDIISSEMVLEYIVFIKNYGESLFNLLHDKILECEFEKLGVAVKQIAVYDNRILCIKLSNTKLSLNSKILVYRKKIFPKYVIANINDIQIDGVSHQKVNDNITADVGLDLDQRILETNKFSILNY